MLVEKDGNVDPINADIDSMGSLKKYLIGLAFASSFFSVLPAQITYQHYLNASLEWWEVAWQQYFPGPTQSVCWLAPVDSRDYSYYHVVGIDSMDDFYWYQIHRDHQLFGTCGDTLFIGTPMNGAEFRLREDSTGRVWKRLTTAISH